VEKSIKNAKNLLIFQKNKNTNKPLGVCDDPPGGSGDLHVCRIAG
jgi:hypothetical protein